MEMGERVSVHRICPYCNMIMRLIEITDDNVTYRCEYCNGFKEYGRLKK